MGKKKSPGRPKKVAALRRTADLRIPVTIDEKRLVEDAATASGAGAGMASWARAVLLRAAESITKKS